MFCQHCGNQLEQGSKFCPWCGNQVVLQPAPQTIAAVSETLPQSSVNASPTDYTSTAQPQTGVNTPPPANTYNNFNTYQMPYMPQPVAKKKKSKAPLIATLCMIGAIGIGTGVVMSNSEEDDTSSRNSSSQSDKKDNDKNEKDDDKSESEKDNSIDDNDDDDISVVIDDDGDDNEIVPMGDEGTWTVFVYICGSDLESENGCASSDIGEMLECSGNEDIRFVIQTGGSKYWHMDIDEDKLQRYCICDGKMELVNEQPDGDMGEGNVLTDFLEWGVQEYPAEKMGLILWNHGGGSIAGVCLDERTFNILSLKEIGNSLYNASRNMTDMFEFVGFDACLMATAETAMILSDYARYMIASQESEPGFGWNYSQWGQYLCDNPDIDGAELGKAICDSYYQVCEDTELDYLATLSVVDLSKMDALAEVFSLYSQDLYELTQNEKELSTVLRRINDVDNYGGNNESSDYYTNMVDMGGIAAAGAAASDYASDVVKALDDAVVYMVNGDMHAESSGLSMYYPLKVEGSQELKIFRDICLGTYYLGFVDKIAYGYGNAGDISDYENEELLEDFENNSGDGYYEDEDYENDDSWDYIDEFEQTGLSPAITFDVEPFIDEDGYYGFYLSEDGLNNTASVQASVYYVTDDYVDLIDLGLSCDIIADWEEGYFCDNFDGYWFTLSDGQMLSVYIDEEGDGYDIYSCPIYLNGEEAYLRICHEYVETGEVTILGVWKGVDENGAASRETEPLQEGDIIIPRHYAYDMENDVDCEYVGEEYIYGDDSDIWFDFLPDGTYCYSFYIYDFYGDYYEPDYVFFTIDGYDIYYDDLSDY